MIILWLFFFFLPLTLVGWVVIDIVKYKKTVIVCYIVLTFSCFSLMFYALGQPKPVDFFVGQNEATVLDARVIPDEVIYLWLVFEGEVQPRYFAIPYTKQSHKQLNKALHEEKTNGRAVTVILPRTVFSKEKDRIFHNEPFRRNPDKK